MTSPASVSVIHLLCGIKKDQRSKVYWYSLKLTGVLLNVLYLNSELFLQLSVVIIVLMNARHSIYYNFYSTFG